MFANLTPYRAYAASPGKWLPRLPSHWGTAPGSGVLEIVREKNTGQIESTVLSLSYGRVVIKPQEKLRGLVPESFETYQVLNPGDIVIRPTDLQNDQTSLRVGQVRSRGIITSAYLGFRTSGVNSDYAFMYLAALDSMKIFYGMGSGLRQNLDARDFKRLPVALPPVEEQAAIVKYLGHAHARIDKAIAAKRKLIALLEEQKQAIIHQAVTRGLDPNVPLKDSGIPWLGEIPAHWEVFALKRGLRALVDCEHKTAPHAEGTEFRVVRTSAVKNGDLVLSGTYTTSREGYDEWTARAVPVAGDVIFTREAPAGEACVLPEGIDACLGQRTVLMKVRPALLSSAWVVHSIYHGPARQEIAMATQGSTVGHFNMDDIARLPMCVPAREEQDEIVRHLESVLMPLYEASRRALKEIELLREFRARLTSDVVTGQVDVREIAANLPALSDEMLASGSDFEEDSFEDIAEESIEGRADR